MSTVRQCIIADCEVIRCLSICLCVCHVCELRLNQLRYVQNLFLSTGSQAVIEFNALVNLKPQSVVIKNLAVC